VGFSLSGFADRGNDLFTAQAGIHPRNVERGTATVDSSDCEFTSVTSLDPHLASLPRLVQDLSETLPGF
jgi:hypothetical protein